jgi:hydrogenase expression/formation protein HypC
MAQADPLVVPISCESTDGCITCGDVAVPLTVVSVYGADGLCVDQAGSQEVVALELVGEVSPGDRLLVHAGVALERLS